MRRRPRHTLLVPDPQNKNAAPRYPNSGLVENGRSGSEAVVAGTVTISVLSGNLLRKTRSVQRGEKDPGNPICRRHPKISGVSEEVVGVDRDGGTDGRLQQGGSQQL